MTLYFDWQEEPITSLGKELLMYPCGQQDKLPDYLELFEWQLSPGSASSRFVLWTETSEVDFACDAKAILWQSQQWAMSVRS